jgi:hypothetical protein
VLIHQSTMLESSHLWIFKQEFKYQPTQLRQLSAQDRYKNLGKGLTLAILATILHFNHFYIHPCVYQIRLR